MKGVSTEICYGTSVAGWFAFTAHKLDSSVRVSDFECTCVNRRLHAQLQRR